MELLAARTVVICTALVIGVCLLLSWRALSASQVEQASYKVVGTWNQFELRSYPQSVEAQVNIAGPSRHSMGTGFRTLANYIFGGNANDQAIAMTAPVSRSREGTEWLLSFTMPSELNKAELPEPQNRMVQLVAIPARTMAALRFPGRATPKKAESMEELLEAAMADAGLQAAGEAILAQYDPPTQLPSLRRNEILIPILLDSDVPDLVGRF